MVGRLAGILLTMGATVEFAWPHRISAQRARGHRLGFKASHTILNLGGLALNDTLDGVDEMIARKIADPERLGIGAWSNSGFMTT